ncbi:MAG: FtsQ-type POTRA domain-containing protein [Acidobacteria bacterium]|nr:FtsQ-type POTRA domain-containing protein [Acidobacteriota bacterium]
MREQVITPRANGRGVAAGARGRAGVAQKPVRRGTGTRAVGESRLRGALAYAPLAAKALLAIMVGVLLFAGYRAAASASFFEARAIDISGTSRVNAGELKSLVQDAVAGKGVWRADLSVISAKLEKHPWVRTAVVSRVLPDGLRIRITERVPHAIVRTSAGQLVWVDEDGVMLSRTQPTDEMPPFFIRGWDEAETGDARTENRARMEKYLEMSHEWSMLGLSERVSEVNLGDLHDVRAQLAGDDAQIEVRLGERNFGNRLKKALNVLDEQRATALGPFITYLVASNDAKITVGRSANAPTAGMDESGASTAADAAPTESAPERAATPASRKREAEQKKKKEQSGKEKSSVDEKKETRPRRVR